MPFVDRSQAVLSLDTRSPITRIRTCLVLISCHVGNPECKYVEALY